MSDDDIKNLLKSIEKAEENLKYTQLFNTGVLYGIIFGLLAAFVSEWIYDDLIIGIPKAAQWIIKGFSLVIVLIISYIGLKEFKNYDTGLRDLENIKKKIKD